MRPIELRATAWAASGRSAGAARRTGLSGAVEADVEQCCVEAPTRRPERLHVDNTRTDGRDNDRERLVLVDESNAAIR